MAHLRQLELAANMKTKARKVIFRVFAGLMTAIVVAITGLMLTFTAAKLEVPRADVGDLPPASPPAGMSISALPTGSYENRAAFAFRGGSWNDIRQFSMTALLVRHPRGNLLIDAGTGKNVDEHVKVIPALQRTSHSKGVPTLAQLVAGGIQPDDLAGVIPTHAHWDHISGLDDLGGVPVMVNAAGKGFIDARTRDTDLLNSFRGVNYKQYDFEGEPYLGFPRSHDVWGDGSVVIVPAPGHTPDSVVVFVSLPSGARYALLGDLVWQMEGIELPAEKPWLLRLLIGEDDDEVRKDIALVRSARQKYTQIYLLPAHDSSAFGMVPVFPASSR
jgi:glyoxylase-like metal-dependent hydrolase (beta-lactamase superfamily II)